MYVNKLLKTVLFYFWKVEKGYGMSPHIVFLPSKRDIENLKIVRIIDFNWFPHMNPSHYNREIYDYVQNITKIKLDENVKYIPFP